MSEHILWETIKEQNEKIVVLEKENCLLGERCNQLLKDKGELTDKIADIKANCDYFLEGKDLEIKELKITDEYIIQTLESKVEKLQKDLRNKRISIKNKKAKIKELESLNSNQAESLRVTMLDEEKKGKRIEELEQQIEKMKYDVISERDKAKRLEDVITYTVLNDILAKWEIKENECLVTLTPYRKAESKKDITIRQQKKQIKELDLDKIAGEVEQDLNKSCPDVLCKDCNKEDCISRKLGLIC